MKKGVIAVVILLAFLIVLVIIFSMPRVSEGDYESQSEDVIDNEIDSEIYIEIAEGCSDGKVIFDSPPVNLEKTELLVPLGLMTGNHVTPIDHQYFQNFDNEEVNIEVYSPGDGMITDIQYMSGSYYDSAKGENVEWADYRLIIKHTCTISSIYIHIDEVTDKILEYAPAKGDYASVNIPVSAGEIIGYYSQNVDYNIVDQDVVLSGFVVPESYSREEWKIHTGNTLEYFNEEIKNAMAEKSLRTYEPIAGKIDYDIDGKLIGNWFLEETNGYAGAGQEDYWIGHLSISPDHLDPNHIIMSIGNYNGNQEQFGVLGNSPNPAEVDQDSGLVKYELVSYDYYDINNERWDRRTLAKIKEVRNYDMIMGVVLLELIDDRELRVEVFPDKNGDAVIGFTDGMQIYVR